jgi:cystathionine beta-synthase
VARTAAPGDVIVVLLPDGGRGYLGKIFNDDWMADYGFLTAETAEPVVGDVLVRKAGSAMPAFVHAHPTDTVRSVIASLRDFDVSQLPVLSAEPPVMAAEVVGSIVEHDLLDALVTGKAAPDDQVASLMSPPLPVVGSGEPVSAAARALGASGAAVVLVDGKPAGVITRQDVLTFLSGDATVLSGDVTGNQN